MARRSKPKRRKPSRRTAADKRRLAEDVVDRCRGRRLSQIPGGKAAGVRLSKFPREALVEGVIVELEHTPDPVVALEIASDHLEEDVDYYEKLATIHREENQGDVVRYRVAYLVRAVRQYLDGTFSLPEAEREVRAFKRRGFTTWVETEDGDFVPVKGASRQPAFREENHGASGGACCVSCGLGLQCESACPEKS